MSSSPRALRLRVLVPLCASIALCLGLMLDAVGSAYSGGHTHAANFAATLVATNDDPPPTPPPATCNLQNSITMLPTHCGSGLVQTQLPPSNLFEKPEADRGTYSFHAMMSAEAITGDGSVEFTLPQGGIAYVGLTETEAFCGYDAVDYLWHVDATYAGSGLYYIREYESPGGRPDAGGPVGGQRFGIHRTGDTVTYTVNDDLYWTSNKHSGVPLHLYVILYAPQTQVQVAQFTASGGLKVRSLTPQLQPVTWQNPINVTVSGNNITKTSGASEGYDAGASSAQQITQNNSFYRFKPATAGDYFLAGLASDDQSASFPNAGISLYFSNGSLYDWISGLGAYLGSFDAAGEYELAVDEGVVNYYRLDPATGARTRITGHGNKVKYPLLFDTSLRTTGSGVRNVVFGQYPYVSPCEANATPTPTPTPTATPTPTPTPAATPANGKIVFVSYRDSPFGEIYTVNPDGLGLQILTNDTDAQNNPVWSPDGTKIAFADSRQGTEIFTMNADGSSQTRLTTNAHLNGRIAWSPDGAQLAFESIFYPNDDPGAGRGDFEISVVNADGSNLRRVSNTPGDDLFPVWSPDSTRILFQDNLLSGGPDAIYAVNADGTNLVNLSNATGFAEDTHPSWSPDGTKIAFARCGGVGCDIYTMNADGSGQTSLTPNSHTESWPVWSPDGTKLAFKSLRDNPNVATYQLYTMNADGSNQTRLTSNASADQELKWSPDGTKLLFRNVFYPPAGPNPEIFVVNADGTGATNLTAHPAFDISADWQPVAAAPTPTPTPATDLRVYASADQAYVPSGGQVTFAFTVLNNGPYPAANVTLASQLPQGVTFNSVVNAGGGACTGTTGGATFSCAFDTIAAENSKTVSISLTATGAPYEVIVVPYTVASTTPESYPADNSSTGQFFIASPPLPTPTPASDAAAELAFISGPADGHANDIYRRSADGSGLANLTNDAGEYVELFWSPDGTKIAFRRYESANSSINLFVMDADGANQTRLTNNPTEQDHGTVWSPDSTRLAFTAFDLATGAGSVHTINADGSDLRVLTATPANDGVPAWSPDGAQLSFTRAFYDQQLNRVVQHTYVMDADGSNQFRLDNSAGANDYGSVWSPDGTQLAFVRSPDDGQGPDLFLAQRDGTNLRNLTNDHSVAFDGPQWSPDGSKLSFLSATANGNPALNVIKMDGSERAAVSGAVNGIAFNNGWSPNGARLVFTVSYGEVYFGLYIVNPDGTELTHIGDDLERNGTPAWSPDSSMLAFTSARNSQSSIDIVNADGTNRVDLTNAPDSLYSLPKWRPVPSPAGPPNDYFANAQVVTGAAGSVTGTNVDATVEPNEQGYYGDPYTSVWYAWTATGNGQATFTTAGSDFDTQLMAFAGASLADLQLLAADDDSGGDLTSSVTFAVTQGTTYYLSVNGYGGATGNIVFNWDSLTGNAPSNDNFAAAEPLTGIPGSVTGDNTFATIEPNEPERDGDTAAATIWYAWTPQTNQRVIFDTTGSALDTTLAVYTGSSLLDLTEVTSNDDNPLVPGGTSRVVFDAIAGTTYFIAVGGYDESSRGAVTLNWRVSVPPPAATRTPGAGQFAFVSNRADDFNKNIFLMNRDGTGQGYLTLDPSDETGPAWSRDATKLLFTRKVGGYSHIVVMNSNGSNQIDLTPGDADSDEAVWSPDGTRIAFHSLRTGGHQVYVMNADGTNVVNVSNYSGPGASNSEPAWSPDGTRIAFRNDRYNTGDIFTVNPDGTNLVRVTNTFATDDRPIWSPDSTKLAFMREADLHVMNADGTNIVRLTNSSAFETNYSWSPDGTKLVFVIRVNGKEEIFTVNADASAAPVNRSNNAADDGAPVWSADGAQFAFVSSRDGNKEIYVMNADGSAQTRLTNNPAEDTAPAWEPPLNTPAGTNVAVVKNGVTLTFAQVTTAGETTVTPLDPNSLQGVPGEYVINANSLAFEIHTTATYTGAITIGFPVTSVNNPVTFSALRVLHGEPPPVPNFVDRTVLAPATPAPNFATRTIYARVTSLSPFLVTYRKETIPPVTTATLSAPANAAGWHKANVNVTLTAVDNNGGSGVQSLTYSAAGAQTIAQTTITNSTVTIPVANAGTTTITFRAQDVDGNVEVAKTVTVKLDKTAPGATTSTVNSTPNSSGYYNGLNGTPAVTLAASDAGSGASGIAGFYVSATGAQTIPANTFVTIANPKVLLTTDGTTTLSYRAVDNAGNEGPTAARTLKVDGTPPVTSYSVASAGTNITLTVNFRDNLSGYAAVNFSVNDGTWQVSTGPFPASGSFSYTFNGPYHESGNYTIKYYGTDAAGNNESLKTVTFTIPPQAITPTLASVRRNSNGTYTATFGYTNANPVTFNIAVGASNNFSPGSQSRGQTTAFAPGTVGNAFTVTWDGSSLTWTVKGPDGQTRQVTARKP